MKSDVLSAIYRWPQEARIEAEKARRSVVAKSGQTEPAVKIEKTSHDRGAGNGYLVNERVTCLLRYNYHNLALNLRAGTWVLVRADSKSENYLITGTICLITIINGPPLLTLRTIDDRELVVRLEEIYWQYEDDHETSCVPIRSQLELAKCKKVVPVTKFALLQND